MTPGPRDVSSNLRKSTSDDRPPKICADYAETCGASQPGSRSDEAAFWLQGSDPLENRHSPGWRNGNGSRGLASDFIRSSRNAVLCSINSFTRSSSDSTGWIETRPRFGKATTTVSPESKHRPSTPSGSACRSLSGITLVSMKLTTFDDERIACFATHDSDDHLQVPLVNIVQDAEVAKPKFIAGHAFGRSSLTALLGKAGLVLQSGDDPVADDSLFPNRKAQELSLGIPSNCDAIRHTTTELGAIEKATLATLRRPPGPLRRPASILSRMTSVASRNTGPLGR